jgi:hypothetical protein
MEPAAEHPSRKLPRLSDPNDDAPNHAVAEETTSSNTNPPTTTTTTTTSSSSSSNGMVQIMPLPLPIAARIASYNVATTSDLARLRGVSRAFYHAVLEAITTSSTGRHFIQCPTIAAKVDLSKPHGTVPRFLQAITAEEMNWSDWGWGDLIRPDDNSSEPTGNGEEIRAAAGRMRIEQIRFVCEPRGDNSDDTQFDTNIPLSVEKVFEACDALRAIQSMEQFQTVAAMIQSHGLMRPVSVTLADGNTAMDNDDSCRYDEDEYKECTAFIHLVMATEVAQELPIRSFNGRQWIELDVKELVDPLHMDIPLRRNCSYVAPIISQDHEGWRVVVLVEMLSDINEDYDLNLESLRLKSAWDTAQRNATLVEGIAIVDDFFPTGRASLCAKIDALARLQEETNGVDFHPGTNNVVRNLVHPALYCHVDGVTTLHRRLADAPRRTLAVPKYERKETYSVLVKSGKDFWGRPYETSVYQWLPTYFALAKDGSCTIEDYINNLVPRDNAVKAALYKHLEKLFQCCLPFIESVFSYVDATRPLFRRDDEDIRDREGETVPTARYCSLRGQKLQVITKIVDYELLQDQTHTGVWHVEGMSHEEIVLTALYIADRDEDFRGADIEFKRTYLAPEAVQVLYNMPQMRQRAAEDMVRIGLIPLGTVSTPKSRLIVFPNSHVHKVSDMFFLPPLSADDDEAGQPPSSSAKRRIVVFFLVNPFRRIISTREVPPQQTGCGGTMSHDDALAHRLALMHERRYTKQDWNVRKVELCEH